MPTKNDEKLRVFERELTQLIDRYGEHLDDQQIRRVLAECSTKMREGPPPPPKPAPAPSPPQAVVQEPTLEQDSQALLQQDSEASALAAPNSETYQDRPTVEIPADRLDEMVETDTARSAVVENRAARLRSWAGNFPIQPPPLPPQGRAPSPPPTEGDASKQIGTVFDSVRPDDATRSRSGSLRWNVNFTPRSRWAFGPIAPNSSFGTDSCTACGSCPRPPGGL